MRAGDRIAGEPGGLLFVVFGSVSDAAAAAEVARVLRPGGGVVISDLLPHEADWMRTAMGDLRLGLKPEQVIAALAGHGFQALRAERALDRYRVQSPSGKAQDFPVFLVRGNRSDARVDRIPNR